MPGVLHAERLLRILQPGTTASQRCSFGLGLAYVEYMSFCWKVKKLAY
jgi:hypothetical protein